MSLDKSYLPPYLCIIIFTLGASFFTTYISVTLSQLAYSHFQIGYVQSGYYAGMLLGAIYIARPIQALGHARSYLFFVGIAAVTVLLQAALIYPPFWLLLRIIYGICIAGVYVVTESWLLANSSVTSRGSVFSLYMILMLAAQSLSQQFLYILNGHSLLPYVIAATLCFLSAMPLLRLPSLVDLSNPRILNFKLTFYLSPFGFMGCLLSGVILSVIYSFVPNFAHSFYLSIPVLMQVTILGGCFLQWPIAKLSDTYHRATVLLYTCIFTTIAAIVVLLYASHPLIVYIFSFLLGGGCFTLYSLSMTTVCDAVLPSEMVNANAILLFAYGIGSVVGPLVASICMDWISMRSLYGYIAVMTGMLTVLGLWSHYKIAFVPASNQVKILEDK